MGLKRFPLLTIRFILSTASSARIISLSVFLQSFAAYEKDLTAKPVAEASAKGLISMVHQGSFAVNGERQVLRIYAWRRGPYLQPPET